MTEYILLNSYKPKRRIVSKPFLNVSKIHPLKQKQVYELIQLLKNKDEVNKIIIFGSSVTMMCHTGSDLDFYVELKNNISLDKEISSIISNYDYWNNYTVDKRLLNEIKKKGITVYERENVT